MSNLPSLTQEESLLVDRLSTFTGTRPQEVLKNALAVYSWSVKQAMTGGAVIARKPTGEEVTLQTAELARLEGAARRLSPKELKNLAEQFVAAPDEATAAQLKERLVRGFFGI